MARHPSRPGLWPYSRTKSRTDTVRPINDEGPGLTPMRMKLKAIQRKGFTMNAAVIEKPFHPGSSPRSKNLNDK